MTTAYTRTSWRGVTLNLRTVAMLEHVEAKVGFTLDPMQGSYNAGGVQASAGTHDGGGAVDLTPTHWSAVVLAAREVGFAAWHRDYLPGEWSEHIHMIAIGDREMSSGAADQVTYYYQGLNGLADHGRDTGPWVHPIPVFEYDAESPWDTGDVYVHKLIAGVKDSDSVRRLQFRLKGHTPAQTKSLHVNGDYGPATVDAVRKWQRKVAHGGPFDGRNVPMNQAKRILGASYDVHE